MTSSTEQPTAAADYRLKYGSVQMAEADLIDVCQALVGGLDSEWIRKMHAEVGDADDFVCALTHALAFHTNCIIAAMRHRAASRERGDQPLQ